MTKPNLPSVTLCMVNCASDAQFGVKVLEYCNSLVDFKETLFVSNNTSLTIPADYRFVKVENSGLAYYQHYVINEIYKHINTSHVLIVQTDGFITNPDKWTDAFLNYDYIGAPWTPYPPHWCYRPYHGFARIGNGGFSLRSQKLLRLGAQTGYMVQEPEDVWLSLIVKPQLELNGIKFPDLKIAAQFSYEGDIPEYPGRDFKDTFGWHGKFNDRQREIINQLQSGTLKPFTA